MQFLARAAAAAALSSCVALAACTSNSTTATPASTPTPANISGDYTGAFNDVQNGNGTGTGTLAQTGGNAGGAIAVTGAKQPLTYQLSLMLNATNGVTGNMVVDLPNNGPQCSFSVTGTYNASSNLLSGNYSAVNGCSGDSGTFSLTQTCVATPSDVHRRPMGPSHC